MCLKISFENANVRNFCNDSRIVENVYKMFVFEKCFENSCFESVRCKDCFILCASNYEQSTYSKSLCSFPPSLDSVILPLVGEKLYHWMWGTSMGHRTIIEGNL